MAEKICGIYKITSPLKRVYIGQSIDIYRRFKTYKKLKNKSQQKLYNSFQKYGVEKHKFEILQQCKPEQLNELEKYYVYLYQCFNSKFGLNLKEGGVNGKMSDETKLKIKIKRALQIMKPKNGWKHSSESIKKRLEKCKINGSYNHTYNWNKNISIALSGKKKSETHKQNLSIAKKKHKNNRCKIIINIETGIFYESIKDAALSIEMNRKNLNDRLLGRIKNKTSLRYA